ncbi:helix-turn-helix transcriptional regulator [Pseudorhodobacter aquimaris]|uniref:helix-turn-helix transcriptional regulator n=1 Tax=Pseudorhodobacter aquimaris TaxID=687412 RepID=UPI0018DB2501|nr:helix-turn-helix transcriptional regulator [Pseudorhodobacter aquimaris]
MRRSKFCPWGVETPIAHRPVEIFLGRVVVTYVQGLPKGGGALCCVQGFEHPAICRDAPNRHGGRTMFNNFNFISTGSTEGYIPRVNSDDPRFGYQACPQTISAKLVLVNRMVAFEKEGGNETSRSTSPPSAFYLAPREKEVLWWAARGKSAWETAQVLGLSETTVKFYIKNACARLQVRNKTHAVAICVSNGVFQI